MSLLEFAWWKNKSKKEKVKSKSELYLEMGRIANSFLCNCLLNGADSVQEKIAVLNKTVKYVGIKAEYTQGENGSGWLIKDEKQAELASCFRKDLERCWPKGEYEREAAAVRSVIEKYYYLNKEDSKAVDLMIKESGEDRKKLLIF